MSDLSNTTHRLLASYEALPYQGDAIPPTHPDSIAAMVRLHGIDAPNVRQCRVLDLGCATGGNIISMAHSLPDSTFVGVDLSPRQIETARETARALDLTNVRFEQMSITDIGEDFGTFDYIVSHGVYSWVPADVQRALLGVCARHLAPQGVVYVSYNTYPGWHLRGLVREMLLFHDRAQLPAVDRIARGRELVEFIAKTVPPSEQLYGALLREEFALLSGATDAYFLHEELEAVNHPVYFADFADRAASLGLAYVTEAQPSAVDAQLKEETRAALRRWAWNDVSYEQYLDFLRGRGFRRSLLCRAGLSFRQEPSPAAVESLFLAARCARQPDAAKDADVEVFRTPDGIAVTMNHPVVRAALHTLIDAKPVRLPFTDLLDRTRRALPEATAVDVSPEMLADAMLRCALVTLVKLHAAPAPCATTLSARPLASPLARLQARRRALVTSLTTQNLELQALDSFLLANTDGTRDREGLIDLTVQALGRGELAIEGAPSPTRDELSAAVSFALQQFLVNGVLTA